MKKTSMCMLVALALFVTSAAIAQAGPQGTQGSSPTMRQPGAQPGQTGYPGGQQPGADNGTTAGQTDQNANQKPEKSEKKLKGCVQSEGGQYVLQTKKGPVNLTGQDVSAHAGHEVAVKGMWESGAGSNSSTASSASSGKTFSVASVDMISDTCKEKEKKGNSGSMGTSSPSGTGSSGTSTPSTGTQPPQ